MTDMTDTQLMELAHLAVPERLRALKARLVRWPMSSVHGMHEGIDDESLMAEIARQLDLKIDMKAQTPDSADVEYVETTVLGDRTTVVQIREGRVVRVIGQA